MRKEGKRNDHGASEEIINPPEKEVTFWCQESDPGGKGKKYFLSTQDPKLDTCTFIITTPTLQMRKINSDSMNFTERLEKSKFSQVSNNKRKEDKELTY